MEIKKLMNNERFFIVKDDELNSCLTTYYYIEGNRTSNNIKRGNSVSLFASLIAAGLFENVSKSSEFFKPLKHALRVSEDLLYNHNCVFIICKAEDKKLNEIKCCVPNEKRDVVKGTFRNVEGFISAISKINNKVNFKIEQSEVFSE